MTKILSALLGLTLLSAASWLSVRFALADRLYFHNTPDSLRRAVDIAPGAAAYHALLAEHQEGAGQNPQPELLKAIDLDPYSSLFLLRIALDAESHRDYPRAEQYLLRAAAVDRKFVTRSALLNFYFRRGDAANFWIWMNRSLEISGPDDTDAIFRLAWEQSDDASTILAHLPRTAATLSRYLGFLLRTRRFAPSPVVARELAAIAQPEHLPLLLTFSETLFPAQLDGPVDVWNTLVSRQLLPFTKLDPLHGLVISNKDFFLAPDQRAFDWRIPPVDGVFLSQAGDGHGISAHFSGTEPEDCEILSQILPVLPGKKYRIGYEISFSGSPLSGLRWEVSAQNKLLATSPGTPISSEPAKAQVVFQSPENAAKLALHYRRIPGSVRADGILQIRALTDEVLP